ncbi:MAG: tyrosine-type recombinase/integrase, partial [Actinomycetia bacterium]|nr:tyrosine-type recombinase/integrase [Actinomycetes bacterium]
MSVYLGRNTKLYFYDFQFRGRRYTGPTGQTSKSAAERVERAERAKVEAGLGPDEASDMTVNVACARWFDEHGSTLKVPDDYERALDYVVSCIGGTTKLRDIDAPAVKEAMRKRRLMHTEFRSRDKVTTRAPTNATVNRQVLDMIRRIHRFAQTAWGAKHLQAIDWKKLRLPERKAREREISDVEQGKLKAAARREYWGEFRAFLGTYGLRLGEMFFSPADVYEVNRQVSIRINDRKDGSSYIIDLDHEDGRKMLARKSRAEAAKLPVCWYREVRGELEPLTYSAARSALRRMIKRAGIEGLTIHDHRHDVATKTTRSHGIAVARSLLGHSSIATTQRYAKVSTEDRL